MAKVYGRRVKRSSKPAFDAEVPAPRRRNAVTTRGAILASARKAFARAGYDGAGVREIAEGAGVTAMLVNRYFGSKEGLFAAVVADVMASPILLTESTLASKDAGERIAAGLVQLTTTSDAPPDGFLIMLRSASSDRAAEIGREQIEAHYLATLTAALDGEHAPQRAALVLALVAGVQVMRQMIGLRALTDCPPSVLLEILQPVFRQLVQGASQPSTD